MPEIIFPYHAIEKNLKIEIGFEVHNFSQKILGHQQVQKSIVLLY